MCRAGTFKSRGFTLIELLVVISILSITLTFVIPRLMGRGEAELKRASRRLLYTIRGLSDEALFKKEKRQLTIDIDSREYWEGDGGKKARLPEGVSIKKVTRGKEEIAKGAASITFFPSGLRDEAGIHLALAGRGGGYLVMVPALGERFEVREE